MDGIHSFSWRKLSCETSRQKLPDRSERVAYFVFGLVTPGGGSFDSVMPKEFGGLSAIGVAIGGFAVCATGFVDPLPLSGPHATSERTATDKMIVESVFIRKL